MDARMTAKINDVLNEVLKERRAQHAKWGEQNHPNGTGSGYVAEASTARAQCQSAAKAGDVTWRHILREEFCEALAESDPTKLRAELVQNAAVCVAWIEAIDRRSDDADTMADEAFAGLQAGAKARTEIARLTGEVVRLRNTNAALREQLLCECCGETTHDAVPSVYCERCRAEADALLDATHESLASAEHRASEAEGDLGTVRALLASDTGLRNVADMLRQYIGEPNAGGNVAVDHTDLEHMLAEIEGLLEVAP